MIVDARVPGLNGPPSQGTGPFLEVDAVLGRRGGTAGIMRDWPETGVSGLMPPALARANRIAMAILDRDTGFQE